VASALLQVPRVRRAPGEAWKEIPRPRILAEKTKEEAMRAKWSESFRSGQETSKLASRPRNEASLRGQMKEVFWLDCKILSKSNRRSRFPCSTSSPTFLRCSSPSFKGKDSVAPRLRCHFIHPNSTPRRTRYDM
jgi:hypothetical protein